MVGFFVAFILATSISPLVIWLYKKFGWLDKHNQNIKLKNTHDTPVPRGGGIVIFLSILIPSSLFLFQDQYLYAILAGALLLAVVGTLDDILDIHPLWRLLVGFAAALIVVGSGIGIAYVSNPFGGGVIHLDQPQLLVSWLGTTRNLWILADLFALIFIIWNMNIVNWSKGVDGQMPGFVSIAAVFIALLSTRFLDDPTQFNSANLGFIVAGAYLGLLIWNWYPQKIMPGYGAGSLAGYFLGILAILSGAKVATVLMVLGVPTADAIFTIARRLKAHKSPFWGDRGHLHHKLLDVLKWSKQKVALFYWCSSLILGILSLYLNTAGKLLTIATVTCLVFAFLIWAKWKSSKHYDQ
jgi:UDP-GlcNAc:undecaprenyl-phosphate GlcNAc-1-phosphate transferase